LVVGAGLVGDPVSFGAGSALTVGEPVTTESRTTEIADQEIPTVNAAATSQPLIASNPIRTSSWWPYVRIGALNRC
jgi:hypothetical protein